MTAQQLVTIQHKEAQTDSRIVADVFGKRHDNVIRDIRKLIGEIPQGLPIFEESSYINEQNKLQVMYTMNRDGFSLLAMGFTGKKALEFKLQYIDAFNQMERRLSQLAAMQQNAEWLEQRRLGKVTRLLTTDTVKEFVDYATAQGSVNAAKYYITLTTMENKALFLLEQKYSNIRNLLDLHQLSTVKSADQIVMKALKDGMDKGLHYKEIYLLAKKRVESYADLIGKSLVPVSHKQIGE